jgi:hypothetical protein
MTQGDAAFALGPGAELGQAAARGHLALRLHHGVLKALLKIGNLPESPIEFEGRSLADAGATLGLGS